MFAGTVKLLIRRAKVDDQADMLHIWLAASRFGHAFLGEEVLEAQREKVRDVYFGLADHWLAWDEGPQGFIALASAGNSSNTRRSASAR